MLNFSRFRFFNFIPKPALCFLLLASSLCGCWFNPNMQGKGEVYLQGEWQQDSVAGQKQLLDGILAP